MLGKIFIIAVLAGTALAGCASLTKGTTQQVAISTSPPGATCDLTRDNALVGQVQETPGSVELDKSRHNVIVRCTKPGFETAQAVLNSEMEVMTVGNLLIGGVVGLAIDAGTGAMNKYDGSITIPLIPAGQHRAPVQTSPPRGKPVS